LEHLVFHERQDVGEVLVLVVVRVDVDDHDVVDLALHSLLTVVSQQTAGVEFLDCYASAAICNKVHDVFSCSPIKILLKRCAQRPVQLCHIPTSNTARLAARNIPLAVTMTPVGLTICPSAMGVYFDPLSTCAE